VRTGAEAPVLAPGEALPDFLRESDEPVNVVVVGGYTAVADILDREPTLFARRSRGCFWSAALSTTTGRRSGQSACRPTRACVSETRSGSRRPATQGSKTILRSTAAWAKLLVSGESVIWLPRDICLWRYGAPGILENGGALTEWLLRELFWANLQTVPDRYAAADSPVLLSALPALLLAVSPDPFAWMRLFRVLAARVEADQVTGRLTTFSTHTDAPNLYAVIAIDGQALGKLLTARLRDRPLAP
jgi:hypothetical protein